MLRAVLTAAMLLSFASTQSQAAAAQNLKDAIERAQTKVVKIFGAGGLRQMEAYQTGVLISADGHVLTAMSYVLDTDDLAVVLHDGRKYAAEYLGSDPVTELAVLKLPVEGETIASFDLREALPITEASPGQRIVALSNLYGIATGDEAVSALQGVITAIAPLKARRGAYQSNYRGDVYVLDAYANNPGAAGGALVDWQGRLLGILGKELRSEVTGTWLNYALPTSSVVDIVEAIIDGRAGTQTAALPPSVESHTCKSLGIVLVPDVLARTPPYVDAARRESPAEQAGLRADDLIVFVNGEPVDSRKAVVNALARAEVVDAVTISVLRAGKVREFQLSAAPAQDEQPDDDNNEVEP